MKPDPLLPRLRILRDEGFLPSTDVKGQARSRMASLFDTQILEEIRYGSGRRVVVVRPNDLGHWILSKYPRGLDLPELLPDTPPRASAVGMFRDSKRAERTFGEPILLKAWGDASLGDGSHLLPIAEWTERAGCASFVLLDNGPMWSFRGRVAIAENLETFLAFEALDVEADLLLWAKGCLSGRVMGWLASDAMAGCTITHFGDFDPVGLREYLRLCAACPDRVRLWVPDRLEDLVQRYGKQRLLTDSLDILTAVRRTADATAQHVLGILDRHCCGLEQESFLIADEFPAIRTMEMKTAWSRHGQ